MMKDAMNELDSVYKQFESWLCTQPCWLQDAAYRIYHGQEITESIISKYADMCVAQVKKETPHFMHLAENETKNTTETPEISVTALSEVSGVNALSPDASLHFLPHGVTVVYGLNGAGKSGFMRIFKQLSGSPFEEQIQPNVFLQSSSNKPSCVFSVIKNDEETNITCDLSSKAKCAELSGIDVFDTRISNKYITSTNHVAYQPFVFTVLSELSSVADRVNRYLIQQISGITELTIEIPQEYSERKELDWVRSLSEKSTVPDSYKSWTQESEAKLTDLISAADFEKSKQRLDLLRSQTRAVTSIYDDLLSVFTEKSKEELSTLYNAFVSSKNRLQVAEKMFSESADDRDKISVNSEDWKALWSLAKKYYETVICTDGTTHFGVKGSICPLCHQRINGDIAVRFSTVNDYVNGNCNENFTKARKQLSDFIKRLCKCSYSANQIGTLLVDIFEETDIEVLKSIYRAIESVLPSTDVEDMYAKLQKIDLNLALNVLSARKEKIDTEIKKLDEGLNSEEQAKLQDKMVDLKSRKWIAGILDRIEIIIANHQRKQELVGAQAFVKTNKITAESNKLASILITDAYIARFVDELKRLAPRIKVKLERAPSQKGNTPYKVSIDNGNGIKCRPEDVLSEGEQRIVALAAFFADATGRSTKTPIVIDDPISSLDANYELSATRRIVELACERQVIVFTHRISLLFGLQEMCKDYDVGFNENHIRSTNAGKGMPDFEDVFRGDLKKQLKALQTKISEVKRTRDPFSEDYSDAIGKICQQFRICVERSVEEVLLMRMVLRFDRRIMTQNKVAKLTRITQEDCNIIDDMMTKYSFTEHSQPVDGPQIDINIDDVYDDIGKFLGWITSYNKKMG